MVLEMETVAGHKQDNEAFMVVAIPAAQGKEFRFVDHFQAGRPYTVPEFFERYSRFADNELQNHIDSISAIDAARQQTPWQARPRYARPPLAKRRSRSAVAHPLGSLLDKRRDIANQKEQKPQRHERPDRPDDLVAQ